MVAFTLLIFLLSTKTAICPNVKEVFRVNNHYPISLSTSGKITETAEPIQGSWRVNPEHDLAGGVVRVSGDGPKLDVLADPTVDIGWDSPITENFQSHPNYKYLSPLSECGFPASQDYQTVHESGDGGPSQTRVKRIVGGSMVPPHRHPWMVQLYLYSDAKLEHIFHCAGTLISNSTILTAAHCLSRISPGMVLDVVVVGNTDRRKIKFCKTLDPNEDCSRSQIRPIHDFEVHKAYNEGNLHHDIGLIYLNQPVKVSETVRPICLPYSSKLLKYWTDLKLTAVGWGATSEDFSKGHSLSEVLKQVQFDLQPRSFCDRFHVRMYGKVKEDRICTGGNTGRASCNGDSGGAVLKPLVIPNEEQGMLERVFQFGIVSAGGHPVDTCGYQGRPAIDTSVFYFMDWILNHIVPGVSSYVYVINNGSNPSSWILDGARDMVSAASLDIGILIDDKNKPIKFINELSTGLNVDVSKHPNLHLLPSFEECGNLPTHSIDDTIPMSNKPDHVESAVPSYIEEYINPSDSLLDSEEREKRIVGGVPLDIENYYPWMAQLYVRSVEKHEFALICSGTIISKRHILTAAHCVTGTVPPFVFDSVVVGQYNRNKSRECLQNECFSPVSVKVSDILVHPEYEQYTQKNNVALIWLSEDLRFTSMVQPVCLPHREKLIERIKLHRYFTVGWGMVSREGLKGQDKMSQILLKLNVDILPRRDCDFVYSRSIDVLDRSRICGGGLPSQGECVGDNGSPLMKQVTMDPNQPLYKKIFQFGIVSYSDCGMQGMPTVYMNVVYYMEWILNNLNQSESRYLS